MVQLSHPYMTTGKTIALATPTFVGKVMSAFEYAVWVGHSFPSKMQMYLNFMAVVTVHRDFGAQENKSVTASTFFPFYVMK